MSGEIDVLALSLMARVYACNARVEAMKAENSIRSVRGESPAYGADSFNYEADEIAVLADALRGRS